MNYLSTYPFDLDAVQQAVNQASFETAQKISFLFAQSICAFFHKHPEAVLFFATAKQLEIPNETGGEQIYISRIDTAHVSLVCEIFTRRGLIPPQAVSMHDKIAKRLYQKANTWSCPKQFYEPDVETLSFPLSTAPLPVALRGVSDVNKIWVLNMFQPEELSSWLSDNLSCYAPIENIVENLICELNYGTSGTGLYLNRHSIQKILF